MYTYNYLLMYIYVLVYRYISIHICLYIDINIYIYIFLYIQYNIKIHVDKQEKKTSTILLSNLLNSQRVSTKSGLLQENMIVLQLCLEYTNSLINETSKRISLEANFNRRGWLAAKGNDQIF